MDRIDKIIKTIDNYTDEYEWWKENFEDSLQIEGMEELYYKTLGEVKELLQVKSVNNIIKILNAEL